MDKLKCPICYAEVEERNFKETCVSPYNFLRFLKSSFEKALNFSGSKYVEVYKLDCLFIEPFPYLEKKLFGYKEMNLVYIFQAKI
jgi:hypothetical protein